ncbi:hypothetical protein FOBRF1_012092 [Fusarium oxysporum]
MNVPEAVAIAEPAINGAQNYEDSLKSTQTNAGDRLENGTITAFGYNPVYRRVLGTLAGVCIVMALTSPLGAIMVAAEYQIRYAGYWGLSWGWIIPNIMMLPQVIAVAELCSSMPVNGGFYWWAAALAPSRISRPVGFIVGWFNILSLATGLAAFAYAIASGLAQTLYIMAEWEATLPALMGMAMGVITLWASLMLLKLERISIIMALTATVLLISCFGVIIGLPASHSARGLPFASASDVFGKFSNVSDWVETGIAVPLSFYTVLFVNSIWTAPAYIAEETHDARRQAPKAIMESFTCTAVVGTGICLVFAFCIPDMDLVQVDETYAPLPVKHLRSIARSGSYEDTLTFESRGFPFFMILYEHWGPEATGAVMVIGTIFSTIGGSGMLLTYATQVAAFARDGGLPYSSYISRVHKRTNEPLVATALLVVLTILFLLLALSQNASDVVYSLASLASLIIWGLPVGFRLFAGDRWVPGPFYTGRFSWSIHFLAVLTTSYFFITRSFPATRDALPLNLIVVLGTLVISIGAYFIAGHSFKGLDLTALKSWRNDNRHSIDGTFAFADVVQQSNVDQHSK